MTNAQTRTVIVALPEGTPATWMAISLILTWLKLPAFVPATAFPVRRRGLPGLISRWLSRHLLDAVRHHGGVTHAAGGRISRLDLEGLATTARNQATARWRMWNWHIAGTTPAVLPWPEYLAKAQSDPRRKISTEEARTRWEAEPRILAMLAFNSYPAAPYRWDLDELAALQAGEAVYVALHWQQAITGDAIVTPDGRLIEPASPSLADRLRYLGEATLVIHQLSPNQHLVAVKAAPAPTT